MSASAESGPIVYWNRAEGREEIEQVYGDRWVRWLYGDSVGKKLAGPLSGRFPSRLYGWYQDSALSRRKIAPFIREFGIPMEEFEPGPFATFNEFFTRRFRPEARPFAREPGRMPAFAEARYLAYERVSNDEVFPVKGEHLSPEALLGDAEKAKLFDGGPLMIARLCPTDYHRFHFPDDGMLLGSWKVPGRLHSVNPAALRSRGEIFATNEREVSILETRCFGRLAYLEVGALCVGKIVQTHSGGRPFHRGDEKGMFLFGASTVIVLGERGAWKPDADLLGQTAARRETLIRLGEPIASSSA